MDLSAVDITLLRAELARRELRVVPARPPKRYKWVCACGNVVYGGGDVRTVFAESGQVWCRLCLPGCRRQIYPSEGRPASMPMVQHELE